MTIPQVAIGALLAFGTVFGMASLAESASAIPTAEEASRVNDSTVGVIFARDELFLDLVNDLETELELSDGLRLVPMLGRNDVQSVYDLLYLKGVDLTLVRSDALEYVRRIGGVESVQRLTHNVVRIADEKIAIVAGRDYASVDELAGEPVGLGPSGSGGHITGTLLFDLLGIEPVVVETGGAAALERVKSGELAAMVYLLEAPIEGSEEGAGEMRAALAEFAEADGVRVLELPQTEELSAVYRPAVLDGEDLPGLVAVDDEVSTYSVDVNLVAYAWSTPNERARKLERFVGTLVDRLENLQGDAYQPTWKAVSLTVETPNIYSSPMITRALEEREATKARLLREKSAAEEQAAAEAEAARLAELLERRERVISRLDEELSETDTARMERMLDRLDTLLEQAIEGGEPAGGAEEGADEVAEGESARGE